MKKITLMLFVGIALFATGCTQNERAKTWGGTMTIHAPEGQTVQNMTWKESQLWVQYRPRKADEKPLTITFKEYSRFGLVEGTVIVIEK
jgi:hypothetical protein